MFEEVEKHSLSVRKIVAWACLIIVVVLFLSGLELLRESALFAEKLCTAKPQEDHAHSTVSSAAPQIDYKALAAAIQASQPLPKHRGANSKGNAAEAVAESPASSTPEVKESEKGEASGCDNALSVLNSHAMVAALVALFSIPTVILIVVLRAFASGKKEQAVPDTVVSWIADKLAAGIDKFTGGKKE